MIQIGTAGPREIKRSELINRINEMTLRQLRISEGECPGVRTDRRSFIGQTICTLLSAIGVALGGSFGTYLLGNPRSEQDAWTDAGELPELSPGVPEEITFSRKRVDAWKVGSEKSTAWVILDGHGEVRAFSPVCTHLGCAYNWQARKGVFLCPCHGSSFDANGKVITGPATRPLDQYAVKLEDKRLWLGPIEPPRAG